jgi:hypothetical protein
LSTSVRTSRSRWAPRLVHLIWSFLAILRLTTWLTADSTGLAAIGSPS